MAVNGEPVDQLKAAIRNGKAVVICGAGVSTAATKGEAPTWYDLLRHGIEWVVSHRRSGDKWRAAQHAQMETNDLSCWLQVADQITWKLKDMFQHWLYETTGSLRVIDDRLLNAIKALEIPIATLNYDGLLTRATGYDAVTWRDPNPIVYALNDPKDGIIHLHGHWKRPDTCVFGWNSYRDATSFAKTQFLQQAISLQRVLVFIGCGAAGFNDPNLGPLNSWFDEHWTGVGREHYWLCRNGENAEGLPKHIVPIRYGATYDDLPTFVESLAPIISAASAATTPMSAGCHVAIDRLPLTRYINLVGREDALAKISDAWHDNDVRILSLIAEGGTGKTALVNRWLSNFRKQDYGGAEAVLGWSFYSQGSKERATSAEPFLNWACRQLKLKPSIEGTTARAEAIADALKSRPIILVLDGVEPLQHGPPLHRGPEAGLTGVLKDSGLATLLRRLATTSGPRKGFVLLTSRLPITNLENYASTSAPVIELSHLNEQDGAKLLRDYGVIGLQSDLEAASKDFAGHALSLTLLASYLVECEGGDIRRRDHIRSLAIDQQNPGHDHARRVIESYDREWLVKEPILAAIMRLVGLFDRPASKNCLEVLRAKPPIKGLTSPLVDASDATWNRAVKHLRDVRLLLPEDRKNPGALDAHPLIREWFGQKLRTENEAAWRDAHSRLYNHLTGTTKESDRPTLEELLPLYQAISHGCQAGRYQEALDHVYYSRLCRGTEGGEIRFHTSHYLGAHGANISVLSWFFEEPFSKPVTMVADDDRRWLLANAGFALRALGRLHEAIDAFEAVLEIETATTDWDETAIANTVTTLSNLSETRLIIGDIRGAIEAAKMRPFPEDINKGRLWIRLESNLAAALFASGDRRAAQKVFEFAEQKYISKESKIPLSYTAIYPYFDLLLDSGDVESAAERSTYFANVGRPYDRILDDALETLTGARATHGQAYLAGLMNRRQELICEIQRLMARAITDLRNAGHMEETPHGLLARAAFSLSCGNWSEAEADLNETRDVVDAEMPLFLCDHHLMRARLAFARMEAFAPLNEVCDIAAPQPPSPEETETLRAEAERNLAAAAELIEKHGYHRRDEELAELRDVLAGKRRYADFRPRV